MYKCLQDIYTEFCLYMNSVYWYTTGKCVEEQQQG